MRALKIKTIYHLHTNHRVIHTPGVKKGTRREEQKPKPRGECESGYVNYNLQDWTAIVKEAACREDSARAAPPSSELCSSTLFQGSTPLWSPTHKYPTTTPGTVIIEGVSLTDADRKSLQGWISDKIISLDYAINNKNSNNNVILWTHLWSI